MDEKSMMWTVLLSLSTIFALFKTVGQPILKLNATLTEVLIRLGTAEDALKGIKDSVKELDSKNKNSHQRIHDRIDKMENRFNDLDDRFSELIK